MNCLLSVHEAFDALATGKSKSASPESGGKRVQQRRGAAACRAEFYGPRSGILEYTQANLGRTRGINRFIIAVAWDYYADGRESQATRLQDTLPRNLSCTEVRFETNWNRIAIGNEFLFCAGFG